MSQTSKPSVQAARDAHEWLVSSGLYSDIIASAGEYDSKIEPEENASLAAHLLNAATVAVNTFVYEAFSPGDNIQEYEEEIRVLAAATALHDTNKYVREAYGFDADGNTAAAFDVYFGNHDEIETDGDDFGIEEFLGEGYRDDLLYLVQRCEIGEDSRGTRRIETGFRGLERYCRIGDQVASIAQRDGVDAVYHKLVEKFDEGTVHQLSFDALEQPILNDLLIGSVKKIISGEGNDDVIGIPIGSTADTVVYLGEAIDQTELESRVEETLPSRINEEFNFSCKLNWNSFQYDILEEVGIPVEDKKEIIAEAFRDLLHDGTAGVEGFEHIPDEFDEYFPVLAKAIYLDGLSDFDDDAVQAAYDEIREEQGGQKVKIHFIAYLIQEFDRHRAFLKSFASEMMPELHDELEPESDAIGTAICRFFGEADVRMLGSKDQMCFLCGEETNTKYQKGLSGIYRTQEYSRRVEPHAKYKSICEVCNLEYALLADMCDRSDVSTNNDLEVAYFYFDDFLGDIRLRGRRSGSVIQDDTIDIDDLEITRSLIRPQYFLQPFYIIDENHRMAVVRQIMQTASDSGMKVVIGRPFTRFRSADTIFIDEEATRPQELLGLDEAERFGPLPEFVDRTTNSHLRRALALFKIMSMVGQDAGMTNPYIQLDRDTFHSVANFAVVNHDNATGLSDLKSYFKTYHGDALMNMQTIAERGIDLFGKQYDSKYKKTKVFREALDAFLNGMHQDLGEEELLDYVESQVYAVADREDYAGHVDTEDAEAFVEAIRSYLTENDLYDLKKLSDWEDALVNSYYYAYDQLLYD
jgi:CRISPR-associated protein Csc3